ncbi:hypothetical protein K7432_000945 [Basidiobolus ranarum]|uniref:Zn(2)-C6 fungal-type domain-containing protein n=1 Tax=Basidiobolus ranarum TaxID=34480 RepID=A0ABR2WAD2_9FUNG
MLSPKTCFHCSKGRKYCSRTLPSCSTCLASGKPCIYSQRWTVYNAMDPLFRKIRLNSYKTKGKLLERSKDPHIRVTKRRNNEPDIQAFYGYNLASIVPQSSLWKKSIEKRRLLAESSQLPSRLSQGALNPAEEETPLPRSELLQAYHRYVSYYFTEVNPCPSIFKTIHGSGLIASGILLQEYAKYLLKPTIQGLRNGVNVDVEEDDSQDHNEE